MNKEERKIEKDERAEKRDRRRYHRSGSTLRIMLIVILLPIFLVVLVTCGTCTLAVSSCGKEAIKSRSDTTDAKDVVVAESRVEELGNIISIREASVSVPDRWGDIKINIVWENTSDKVVKYITFYYYPYNAVGDRVSDLSAWDKDTRNKVTGPIEPGKVNGKDELWGYWSNRDIMGMTITKVEIEYMDGSAENILENEIKYIMD